jgi:hypothetical protein
VDREVVLTAIKGGPVVVHMNDDSRYEIPSVEFATVSDIAVAVLVKDAGQMAASPALARMHV